MNSHFLISAFFFFVYVIHIHAQEQPVSWQINISKTDSGLFVIAKADIDKGWYVYSQFLESDDGPIATQLVFNDTLYMQHKATEEGPSIYGYDDMFGMDIKKFKKTMLVARKIHGDSGKKVDGFIEFMTCNDEMCLPPREVPFSLYIP